MRAAHRSLLSFFLAAVSRPQREAACGTASGIIVSFCSCIFCGTDTERAGGLGQQLAGTSLTDSSPLIKAIKLAPAPCTDSACLAAGALACSWKQSKSEQSERQGPKGRRPHSFPRRSTECPCCFICIFISRADKRIQFLVRLTISCPSRMNWPSPNE